MAAAVDSAPDYTCEADGARAVFDVVDTIVAQHRDRVLKDPEWTSGLRRVLEGFVDKPVEAGIPGCDQNSPSCVGVHTATTGRSPVRCHSLTRRLVHTTANGRTMRCLLMRKRGRPSGRSQPFLCGLCTVALWLGSIRSYCPNHVDLADRGQAAALAGRRCKRSAAETDAVIRLV
jgi:hypothetical protein